jgi:hypothetical protein
MRKGSIVGDFNNHPTLTSSWDKPIERAELMWIVEYPFAHFQPNREIEPHQFSLCQSVYLGGGISLLYRFISYAC